MANDFVEILSPKALEDLKSANAEVLTLISNMDKIGAKMKNISTPSSGNSAVSDLTAQYKQQELTIASLQKKIVALEQAKQQYIRTEIASNRSSSNAVKNTRDQTVANQILRAETDRNFRANTLLAGAYARASAQLLILKKEAKDAAIAFGEESVQAQRAAKAASELDARIKSADATVGDFQRNVGNYSSGVTKGIAGAFAGIRQLAYLLPGIGIAGIFNLAFEAIIPVIQQFDIFKKKVDILAESKKALNDITIEANKNAVQETISLQGNLKTAQDANLPIKERLIAVQNLQDTYPFYFENLTKEQILAGQTAEAEKALTEAILSRAMANAAISKITENEGKIIEIELQRIEAQKQIKILNEQIEVTEKNLQKAGNVTNSQGIALSQMYDRRKSIVKDWMKLTKDQNDIQQINNTLTTFATTNQEKAIGLDYKKEKAEKEKNRTKLEAIQLDKDQEKSKNALIAKLEEEIAINQKYRDEASTNIEQYREFDSVVKNLSKALDLIKDPSKYMSKDVSGLKAQQEAVKKHKEGIEALNKEMAKYVQGFQDSFANNAGLKTTFDILNDKILGFGSNAKVTAVAVAESFQEMYNFINEMSQQNFDAEKQRLDEQTKIALAFAGDSDSAKAEIERQAEERRKEILRREFNAKKEQAKFNIIIDTAQAVVAALPNIPLSILIGVLGLAQLAKVNAQQVPAYKDGTQDHKGGLMLVNDGNGSNYKETIQTPDGKIYQPKERNVFMNAPKGTKVFTHDQWQKNLDSILMSNNINYAQPNVVVNSGMSDAQVDRIVSTIANKSEAHLNIDKHGFDIRIRNGHTTLQKMNSRVTFGRE